ncbi:uncharacterized protein LY89DRAFT_758763 [Mollisia scopiformis]|uniref:Uncharacterized protein n=1 Tax=Mollisia scopiformis TaxID=149040 RepID=A0A194WTQ6_MOLSC|nr:uncharacterized protein LY89DRAFT_758763 [Mollisia scopiformis]KUJ11069.1 hypothetical protein LY89DRAFT_758763 [Mollisia scopiformis]
MPPSIIDLPTELLLMIGDLIVDRRTLRALVRQCHLFAQLFSALAYERLVIGLFNHPPEFYRDAHDEDPPSTIKHTKYLEVLVWDFEDDDHLGIDLDEEDLFDYKLNVISDFGICISKWITSMPNLESFRFDCRAYEDTDFMGMMGPYEDKIPELCNALWQCKTLRHLSVLYYGTSVKEPDWECLHNIDFLTGFKNLTSLELYGFYELELSAEVKVSLLNRVAHIISKSPRLKKLGLSLTLPSHHFENENPDILIVRPDDDYLEMLCLQCSSCIDFKPLKLETLRLGHGTYLLPSMSKCENYLAKLVDLESLRNLHVWNGGVRSSVGQRPTSLNVQWDMLKHCSALRQLEITILDASVTDWLNRSGNSIQELIITQPLPSMDPKKCHFDDLKQKLPTLKMVYLTDKPVYDAFETEETSSSDSSSSDSGNETLGNDSSITRVLKKTVLDLICDHGLFLERLAIDIDLNTEWFVKVGNCGSVWQVTAPKIIVGTSENQRIRSIGLRKLRPDEVVSMYMFAIDTLNNKRPLGLSCPHFAFNPETERVEPTVGEQEAEIDETDNSLIEMETANDRHESYGWLDTVLN